MILVKWNGPIMYQSGEILPLAAVIARRAAGKPDVPFIIAADAPILTNAGLAELAQSASDALRRAGFNGTARLALTGPSGPEFAAAAAVIASAAICTPLNPGMAAGI